MQKRRYTFAKKFHLSPIENITNIRKRGLLAERNAADNDRVWLCDWEQIPYIARHLLDHHGFSHQRFMVYSVMFWLLPYAIRKHRDGVYYYIGNVPFAAMTPELTIDASSETIQKIAVKEGVR